MFTEVYNEVRPNYTEWEAVDWISARQLVDVNEDSSPNSDVVDVEEGANDFIHCEDVDDEFEVWEVLFEVRALVNSRNRAASVWKETGLSELSSLGPILIGMSLNKSLTFILPGTMLLRKVWSLSIYQRGSAMTGSWGVARTSLPAGRFDEVVFVTGWIVLKIT